ncbi:MAG: PA14 domain-containing protein, partial [Planctomycetales bacterium]
MSCPSVSAIRAAIVCGAWMTATAFAQQDDAPEYLPGLVGEYASKGRKAVRVDEQLAFAWGDQAPDPRVSSNQFSVRWTGRLMTLARGTYQLRIHAAGKVRLELNGKKILEQENDQPGWMLAEPMEFEFGYHPLTINFTKTADRPRISLFWQGPGFQLEPIPGRRLLHDSSSTPGPSFEQGVQLVKTLRCAGCHASISLDKPLPAPSLTRLRGQLSLDCFARRLQESSPAAYSVPASKTQGDVLQVA